ncbi:MAG: ATP-grasp domain-containing protein [[Clostridium] symbiosum]
MKKNVLVFSGGSYPAIQIYYCLKDSLRFNPIAASSYEDHSQFVFRDSICTLPFIQEPNFIHSLNLLIDEKNISFIIPTHDTIALYLMEHKNKINAIIVCSPFETALLCRYKSKTYKQLQKYHFIPKLYDLHTATNDFPVFIKPDIGQGSQDCSIVYNRTELKQKLVNKESQIICEYLPGDEITIDCFTNRHKKLIFANARSRERILNGISARSRNIPLSEELRNIVDSINQEICFRGYWFVQLKRDRKGEFKLLEISTRFAGTFGLSKSLDVNLPLLALCDFSDMDVSITPNKYEIVSDKTYIDRYKINFSYQRVYIDFDDTIVHNRKLFNTMIMAFLYQCLNKEIELILITKHAFDIRETMKRIHLSSEIFSQIIVVPENTYKYQYMDTKIESIFIDNAYEERQKVKQYLNMNTFDSCNVDCLLDWSQ